MQSETDTELLIEEARLELDAITGEADSQGDAASAIVNLKAASRSPKASENYIEKATEHVLALCATLDPEGPYHKYARNARDVLERL